MSSPERLSDGEIQGAAPACREALCRACRDDRLAAAGISGRRVATITATLKTVNVQLFELGMLAHGPKPRRAARSKLKLARMWPRSHRVLACAGTVLLTDHIDPTGECYAGSSRILGCCTRNGCTKPHRLSYDSRRSENLEREARHPRSINGGNL